MASESCQKGVRNTFDKDVKKKQIEMIRFRNTNRAFEDGAEISIEDKGGLFRIIWKNGIFSAAPRDMGQNWYQICGADEGGIVTY